MESFIAADVSGPSSSRSTRGSLHHLITALVFTATAIAACSKSPPPDPTNGAPPDASTPARPIIQPRLAELRTEDATPPDIKVPGVADGLSAMVESDFFASFERTPDDPTACRASVAIGYALVQNRRPVLTADAGEAHGFFEGEIFCPDPDHHRPVEGFRLRLTAERPFGGGHGITGPARLREVVRELSRDGADALFGQVRVRYSDDAAIRQTLATSDHPGILAEASSEAGERRLTDAATDLVRLTVHTNRRVSVRAGAALGLLRVDTPEVVKALVRLTEGPDGEKHLVAVHALADIGTAETRRYLEVIAVGHPNPAIRQLARERLGGNVPLPDDMPPEPVPDPIP